MKRVEILQRGAERGCVCSSRHPLSYKDGRYELLVLLERKSIISFNEFQLFVTMVE
jgi:hypothetical protein